MRDDDMTKPKSRAASDDSGDDDTELDRLERDIEAFVRDQGGEVPETFRDGLPVATEDGGTASAMDDRLGAAEVVANRYHIEEEVGVGAQGVVYRAIDIELERPVAVKIMRPFVGPDAERRRLRFEREARSASRLSHVALCPVHHSGTHDGKPFIIMPLYEGRTLARLITTERRSKSEATTKGPVTIPGRTSRSSSSIPTTPTSRIDAVVQLVQRLADGVEAAHREGVFHRDIKPGNVMVDDAGNAVLVDFGCARDDDADGSALTVVSDIVGTIEYMPPESLVEGATSDPRRADVYGLGATLYECLTLRRPFVAHNRHTLLKAAIEGVPPAPRTLNSTISSDLDVVVRTATERDPNRRYESAEMLAEELGRVRRGEPIVARPVGRITRLMRWAKREPALAASLVGLVLGLILAVGLWLEANHQRQAVADARDDILVEALKRDVDELWPMRDTMVPAMNHWLTNGRRLKSRDGLAEFVEDVERRRRFATELRRVSLEETTNLWNDVVADILADDRYSKIEIVPQLGLIPLGRDPRSGFHEFLHLDSHEGPTPVRADGRVPVEDDTGIVFVLLPGGRTWIGAQTADEDEPTYVAFDKDTDLPEYEGLTEDVEVAPFFISKYEVTNGQWRRIMKTDPNRYFRAPQRGHLIRTRHPVEMVSWNDCAEFVRRVELEIPTEVQWEYAARAEGPTMWWDGLAAEEIGIRANLRDTPPRVPGPHTPAKERSHHAASDKHDIVTWSTPNAFGLHDMVGNVWEWCHAWSFEYNGRTEPSANDLAIVRLVRPIRGGSFEDPTATTRLSRRLHQHPDYRVHNIGLRPVRGIDR